MHLRISREAAYFYSFSVFFFFLLFVGFFLFFDMWNCFYSSCPGKARIIYHATEYFLKIVGVTIILPRYDYNYIKVVKKDSCCISPQT